jgi:hypothetical protein
VQSQYKFLRESQDECSRCSDSSADQCGGARDQNIQLHVTMIASILSGVCRCYYTTIHGHLYSVYISNNGCVAQPPSRPRASSLNDSRIIACGSSRQQHCGRLTATSSALISVMGTRWGRREDRFCECAEGADLPSKRGADELLDLRYKKCFH